MLLGSLIPAMHVCKDSVVAKPAVSQTVDKTAGFEFALDIKISPFEQHIYAIADVKQSTCMPIENR